MLATIRRRELIAAIGGLAAWPLATRAQQSDRMRRIGVLMNLAESDPEGQARIAAFREGLGKLGWAEGRELQIEYRWFAGDSDRARAYAAELVKLKPDVIFAATSSSLAPLQRETRSLPIVFAQVAEDPKRSSVSLSDCAATNGCALTRAPHRRWRAHLEAPRRRALAPFED
jgi:putative ABC transport system substrate-binding protein